MEPLELKRAPASDQERGLGAEERREEGEGDGVEGGEEVGGGEEEGDLSCEERHPYPEEGSELDVERVDDVGDEEADREGGEDRSAAEVEEEGGAGDEGGGDAGVVGERGGGESGRGVGSGSEVSGDVGRVIGGR